MKTTPREIRLLKGYAALITIAAVVALFSAFSLQEARPRFEEIDVERINIVEADGTLRMVISNRARQHPGIVNGKVIERSGPRPPGMIFFNQHGDEMGGLIFGANGDVGHFGQLTFDKVRGDQTIGFRHLEGDNGAYATGIEMWQQPEIPVDVMVERYRALDSIPDEERRSAEIQAMIDRGELTTRRLFLGKGRNNTSSLELFDIRGEPRLRISVTAEGEPRLEFLDAEGNVTLRLPEGGRGQ